MGQVLLHYVGDVFLFKLETKGYEIEKLVVSIYPSVLPLLLA